MVFLLQFLERSYRVAWKHTEIGLLKNIATDMWRLDGDGYPCDGAADDFESLLSETDARERLVDLSKIIAVTLTDTQDDTHEYLLSCDVPGAV